MILICQPEISIGQHEQSEYRVQAVVQRSAGQVDRRSHHHSHKSTPGSGGTFYEKQFAKDYRLHCDHLRDRENQVGKAVKNTPAL